MNIDDRAIMERADAIQQSLGTLNTNIETLTEYGQKNRKFIRRLTASIIFQVVLLLGLGGVAWNAKQASHTAISAAKAANIAEKDLCAATQRSWDTRTKSNEIITKPAVLSPQVERLFPASQIESLRLQIESANRVRAAQRDELITSNGPRPVC